MAGPARRADAADDGENHVLRGYAARERTLDAHAHVLHLARHEALRCENVLDFRGADAVREAGKSAMRAGVRIAAHDRHARQGRALLGADDMHDALAPVEEREVDLRAEVADVRVERLDLQLGERVADAFHALIPPGRRRVVVGGGDHRVHAPGLAPRDFQPFVGLRAGDLMHEVPVDVQQRRAVLFEMHEVAVPKLVVKSRSHAGAAEIEDCLIAKSTPTEMAAPAPLN